MPDRLSLFRWFHTLKLGYISPLCRPYVFRGMGVRNQCFKSPALREMAVRISP